MIGHVENPQKLDIHSILNADAKRSAQVETLPSWMQRDTSRVRYAGHEIDLDESTLPRLDGIMGAVHLFRKGETSAPATARLDTPQTPDASPVAQLLAWGFLGVNVLGLGGGALLRKAGSSMGIPELSAAGAYMQRATVSLDMLGATACSGALATEVAPVVAPMEFQIGDGIHPETAGLTNFPLKDLEANLAKIDTSRAPEVAPLFTALKDSVYGSTANPIRLAVDGKTIDLSINNPDAAVATFQHVSDGKGFSFDFAMVPLGTAIVDPSGKEHVLISFRDASGQVVVRQGVWDKDELVDGARSAGTLRFVEWGAEPGAVNARLLMQVQTDTSKPDYTEWTLIDTDTSTQLSLASEHAIQLAATPSFSDSLISFGNKPSYSAGGELTQPEGLPTTIALTPTADAPTIIAPATEVPATPVPPTEVPATPTEAGPKAGDTNLITENGHDYLYVYKDGQWVREITSFPLWDSTKFSYVLFNVSSLESAVGERSLVSIVHPDSTSDSDPSPLRSTFKPELEQRYFGLGNLESASNEQSKQLQLEMMKGLDSQAFIPIIVGNGTPEGASFKVRLSTETGINVTIMSPEQMKALGGENVITLHKGTTTFYVQAHGVDEKGSALYRLAFDGSINDISDDDLRDILFMIPGNLVDHVDQREQGFTDLAQGFSQYSEKSREGGTQDVFFERVPLLQP